MVFKCYAITTGRVECLAVLKMRVLQSHCKGNIKPGQVSGGTTVEHICVKKELILKTDPQQSFLVFLETAVTPRTLTIAAQITIDSFNMIIWIRNQYLVHNVTPFRIFKACKCTNY